MVAIGSAAHDGVGNTHLLWVVCIVVVNHEGVNTFSVSETLAVDRMDAPGL